METVTLEEFKALQGKDFAPSDWLEIAQDRIDQFADCTGDHQYIHVDTEAAKRTPFGTTIAHGFLLLSLLPAHRPADMPLPENMVMSINYGLNKVRFITPVKVDSKVRFRTKILSVVEKSPGRLLLTSEKTLELEGEEKPGLVAETLQMIVTKSPS